MTVRFTVAIAIAAGLAGGLMSRYLTPAVVFAQNSPQVTREAPDNIPQHPPAGAVDAATAEVRRQYRAFLEEGLKYAEEEWDFISKQYVQKTISYRDTYEPQEELVRCKARLAAFDAGLIPPLPAGPGTPAALAARTEYRDILQAEVQFEALHLDATRTEYSLGNGSHGDVVAAQARLVDAKLELAALDAGFAQPPASAPARVGK
jgi:hypothetical protein